MPEIIIVAGPNGAGKTSFARQHAAASEKSLTFINADEIARELPASLKSQARRDLQAARIMLQRIDYLTAAKADFMFETTLAALAYIDKIRKWQKIGYRVTLFYLRLANAEQAIERVRRRVAAGGHDIPELTIRRRFHMSLEYLDRYYKPAVDEWYIWDSLEGAVGLTEAWDD